MRFHLFAKFVPYRKSCTHRRQIPAMSDARPRHTSRGFLPWRFAYAGPGVRRATVMEPPSANLHTNTRDYLIDLAKRTELLKLTNVEFALGEPHDPRLPASSLDAAILVHMYHEIAQPYAFLYNLAPALKRGARVGIVDLERPTSEHGTPIKLLRCELTAVGYREIATYQLAGDGGYLAVFSAPEEAGRKSPGDIVACPDGLGTR